MRSTFISIAATSALGCTSADHMDQPAPRDWSGAVEHASLLRSATLSHHDAILSSSDLSTALVEEERYRAKPTRTSG